MLTFRFSFLWILFRLSLGLKCIDGITRECSGEVICNPDASASGERDWTTRCIKHFDGECILRRQKICEEVVKCIDFSPCDLDCETHYRCQDSGECFRRSTVCDGNACDGCPEDHEWTNGHGFKCLRNGYDCILPQQLLYDNISDCDAGIDRCFHPRSFTKTRSVVNHTNGVLNKEKCFLCLDGAMLIPSSRVCDGLVDCSDLSDECLCEEKVPGVCEKIVTYNLRLTLTESRKVLLDKGLKEASDGFDSESKCEFGQLTCSDGKCVDRSSICDGIRDCEDDENGEICGGTIPCKEASASEPRCRCKQDRKVCLNYYGSPCDGVSDCPLQVSQKHSLYSYFPDDECVAKCPDTNFTCLHKSYTMNGAGVGLMECTHEDNSTTVIGSSKYCDGIEDCPPNMADEEEARCTDRFYCEAGNLINIDLDLVCDGTEDCDKGEDEAIQLCGDEKFYCPALGGKKVNIPVGSVCDFYANCDDASDEASCTDGRFYCENGDPLFVRERQIFDGRGDCSDWSDECPTINQSTSTDVFSSRYELLANPILRALVWIMGLLSLVGNAVVMYKEILCLVGKKKLSPVVKVNRILVLNLAVSDILMGVYLMSLAIAGLKMQGIYCSQDLAWRSSGWCIGFGVLSVISSETSVITMVLLTGSRLYVVMRPFKSSSLPRIRYVLLAVLLAWATSLVLALLPLSSSFSHIFVDRVKFEDNPFSRNAQVSLEGAKTLFRRMMTFDLRPNASENVKIDDLLDRTTWSELETLSEKYHVRSEYFNPKLYFGYYSIHSVCIPKFFITKSDPAWKFSLAVNVFNFISFAFVASAYAVIYVKSRETSEMVAKASSKEKNTNVLQRKILRLVITDFCCWMPICIMAFAKLAGAEVGDKAYGVAAVVLLPINSALNPILYSDLLDAIHKGALTWWSKRRERHNDNNHSSPHQSTGTTNL